MTLAPHTIFSKRTKSSKRVGRGNSSQKGTTAGRGTKGQKSRSGGRGGLKIKGMRSNILKVPKLRGFTSHRPSVQTLTLALLDRKIKSGRIVTLKWLKSAGLIKSVALPVKIVGKTEMKNAITVKECILSKGAVAAIEKAGGTVIN